MNLASTEDYCLCATAAAVAADEGYDNPQHSFIIIITTNEQTYQTKGCMVHCYSL